jgi:molybdopterin-guanine dinucleotide biosynthesis protein A
MADAETAGFVLAGGKSTRMGRDKALLDDGRGPLVARVAAEVQKAAGHVTLIGSAERYGHLGFAVVEDLRPGNGPLGGIETALAITESAWNLVVACDMPNLTAPVLTQLLVFARKSNADCVLGRTSAGVEPLFAVYRRESLPAVRTALDRGILKITDALIPLHVIHFEIDNRDIPANVNTPEDWSRHLG